MPVDRPRIANLSLVYQASARQGAADVFIYRGRGEYPAAEETKAELTLSANVAARHARRFGRRSGDRGKPSVGAPKFERIDGRTFRAEWMHQAPLQMKVGMVASESQLASRPRADRDRLQGGSSAADHADA